MTPFEHVIAHAIADAINNGLPPEENADVVIDDLRQDGADITFYADGEPYKLTVTWDGGDE